MNTQARQFIASYFGISAPRIGMPPSIRRRVDAIDTIVIDSSALSDGSLHLPREYTQRRAADHPLMIARRALVGNTSARTQLLREGLGETPDLPYDPIASSDGTMTHSTWHHGESYQSYWVGDFHSVLHYSDLTENEREHLTHSARKAGAEGHRVYGVGTSTTKTRPGALPLTRTLEHVGIVTLQQTLYPEVTYTLEQLREAGIRVVYLSTDSVDTTTMLAHLSCLVSAPVIAGDADERGLSVNDQVIGGFTEANRQRFCQRFNPETTLFIGEPLPQMWRQFRTLRSR